MSVLTSIQRACTVIGLDVPSVVFASTEREHTELSALAVEVAERIKKDHDWNKLKQIHTLAGDGTTTSFAFPLDYARMTQEGQLWSSERKDIPLTHIGDSDTWLADIISGHVPENPQWTVYGSLIYINPAPVTGEVISFFYIKSLAEFVSDTDTFILGERLLTLAMIWQWKANKGLPYAEDMQTYEIELRKSIQEDQNASSYATGLQRYRKNDQFITIKEFTP